MKLLLEGTAEQIDNLKALLAHKEHNLPEVDTKSFIDNLWHVEDVQSIFKCDDETALDILERSLTNEATMGQIWFAIRMMGEDDELEEVDDEEGVEQQCMFEYPYLQPEDLREVIKMWQEKIDEGLDYVDTLLMLQDFESIGYTFDYGLGNTPYNLRPKND